MTLNLYQVLDDPRVLHKTLGGKKTITGKLKESTSMLTPSFLCDGSIENFAGVNYLQCLEFNRYYYITDIISEGNNLTRLNCDVDVLMSNAAEISKLKGSLSRQEYNYDPYLKDEKVKLSSKPVVSTIPFKNKSTSQSFVLVMHEGGAV